MAKRERDASVSGDEEVVTRNSIESRSQSTEATTHTPKYATLESSPETAQTVVMQCMLPPHKPLGFTTYEEYETHYRKDHTNRCVECSKNFPTSHLLDLHIAENHDPINAARREVGEKTFACLVEGCDKVCSDWKKRRSHLVDKHGFPKNYDFLVVDHGIDGRWSVLRAGVDSNGHRKSSRERARSGSSATQTTESTEATLMSETRPDAQPTVLVHESANEGTMNDLADSMSALQMVPRSVTFGRRKGRPAFAKK